MKDIKFHSKKAFNPDRVTLIRQTIQHAETRTSLFRSSLKTLYIEDFQIAVEMQSGRADTFSGIKAWWQKQITAFFNGRIAPALSDSDLSAG
ncbi:MAG TPA: hypothetical protein PKN50_01115 [Spirochaetota bacterium]|nr:hypothetical protein [Spirochaetota bacterium]HPV42798.1 hypothetical protein [Spirochaetota bacterium]